VGANEQAPLPHVQYVGPTATAAIAPHVANKANFALVAKVDLALPPGVGPPSWLGQDPASLQPRQTLSIKIS